MISGRVVPYVLTADSSAVCAGLKSSVADWNYAGSDFYCDIAIPHTDDLDVVYRDEHVLAYHHTTILADSYRGGA